MGPNSIKHLHPEGIYFNREIFSDNIDTQKQAKVVCGDINIFDNFDVFKDTPKDQFDNYLFQDK